jgi:DNA topoisomerase I
LSDLAGNPLASPVSRNPLASPPTFGSGATFRETDHPRGEGGKFSDKGGGKRAALHETEVKEGKRVSVGGESLPQHIEDLKIPPAWTDVKYSHDPRSDLLVVGKDSKGRLQSIYSDAFSATQAAAKFDRIEELRKEFSSIKGQNDKARESKKEHTKDAADCLALIMDTGIRPGSDADTGAKVKAYGATTLEGRHIVKTDDGVSLRFVGKKGVALDIPVHDKAIASMLAKRAERSGDDGRLFPATNDKMLLDHVHSLDGGGFKTKDFRTHVGTSTAYDLVSRLPTPKNEAEYKKSVMEVAKKVSKKLGNTPTVALQSYISPTVFSGWRIAI